MPYDSFDDRAGRPMPGTPEPHSPRPSTRRPSDRRMSVPSARDTLEEERFRYSNPAGPGMEGTGIHRRSNTPSPAQMHASQHADEYDLLGPLRGKTGVSSRPNRASRTGSFAAIPDIAPTDGQGHASGNQPAAEAAPGRDARLRGDRPSVRDRQHRSSRRPSARSQRGFGNDIDQYRQASNYVSTQRAQRSRQQPEEFSDAQRYRTRSANQTRARAQAANGAHDGAAADSQEQRFVPMATGEKRRRSPKDIPARTKFMAGGAAAVLVAALGVFGVLNYVNNGPVEVTVNGTTQTVEGPTRNVNGLIDAGLVSPAAGNYIAVDGTVIRSGDGYRATAQVNGEQLTTLDHHLSGGDEITITDGADIMEPYTDSDEQAIPYDFEVKGSGALHVYTAEGHEGKKVVRVGDETGRTVETVAEPAQNTVVQYYNANTGGDKVACITIDDGPWDGNTAEILDLLKENDAHATFYVIGNQVPQHSDVVKRASEEGHEIATHTYDHADGSGKGVSLNLMSSSERKDEVTKGLQAIQDAGITPSVYFRAPGGNFDKSVAQDLNGLVKGEIGWNVDTLDWKRPGADTIATRIKSLGPGEVALMHDGGGDRSQTVAALREAIPYLKSQGYELITISELIERYPYSDNGNS